MPRPSSRIIDLSGQKFGRLTVKDFSHVSGGSAIWNCRCNCGNTTKARAANLKKSHTKSCGCLQIENSTTHGYSAHPLYPIWSAMIARCENPKNHRYNSYGGRGISVCPEWRGTPAVFFEHMGVRPEGLTLDRIDNDGDYELKNCRWATAEQQQRNSRHTRRLTHNGESFCITEWAEKTGIPRDTLYARLNLGWSIEKTLTQPVRFQKRRNP